MRDIDLLTQINQVFADVSFTITTADDELSKKLEPGAPPSSARFEAMRQLSEAGITTGVTMQPILPFIADTLENTSQLVDLSHAHGAKYILYWFGLTLRAGSRDYYYKKLDQLFPGLKEKYIRQYGETYICNSPNWEQLDKAFRQAVAEFGIPTKMPIFTPEKVTKKSLQMKLL